MKPLLIILLLQLAVLQTFSYPLSLKSSYTTYTYAENLEVTDEIPDSNLQDSDEIEQGNTSFLSLFNLMSIMALLFISSFGIIAYIRFYEKKKINHRLEKEILTKIESENALKLSETKFKEANATKDKFFSILSHDLKSPFAAMLGMTEILEKEYHQLKESDRIILIKELGKATRNTYALLEELLSWSQSQRGLLDFNPQPTKLYLLCNESIELVGAAALKKSITINCMADKGILVYADHNMLETVLRNLLTNAIKFTNKGGEVKIHCQYPNIQSAEGTTTPKINVLVTDTGVGISQENIGKLLKVEEKYKTPGTDREMGTGLGLIICKEFVEKHGGELTIESEQGKGSSFGFTIPLAKTTTTEKARSLT